MLIPLIDHIYLCNNSRASRMRKSQRRAVSTSSYSNHSIKESSSNLFIKKINEIDNISNYVQKKINKKSIEHAIIIINKNKQ